MKKLLIVTSLVIFLGGFMSSYASATISTNLAPVEQTDDDPTQATAESSQKSDESTKSSDTEKKSESGEKKACCKKAEKSECTKK